MAIVALTGKPGDGKTWELSNMLMEELERGTPIFINYALLSNKKEFYCRDCEDENDINEYNDTKFDTKNLIKEEKTEKITCSKHGKTNIFERYIPLTNKDYPNLHYWHEVSEWRRFKRGIIGIDEGQIFFNSRNWEQLPLKIQYKLQLHRHDGLDIWLTTQNIKRIDVVVRELVQEFYKMEKLITIFGFTLFRKTEYDTDEITQEQKTILRTRYRIANWRERPIYDTLGKIPLPDRKGYQKTFIKCESCGKEKQIG